ncbi:MAG: LysR family transcriptional regulator [Hespellia sp.]|nr:LysR family transcriptional regulator [Hespellia sp.]
MKPKIKVQIVSEEGESFFGIGVAELLHHVDETGSLNSACQKMHLSYSKGWKIVNRAEKQLGHQFIERSSGGKNGGGSLLTEDGRRFLEQYDEYNKKVQEAAKKLYQTSFLFS